MLDSDHAIDSSRKGSIAINRCEYPVPVKCFLLSGFPPDQLGFQLLGR